MEKRTRSAEEKAKLVIECLKEELHIGEIAHRENISRTQLQNWKREFLENAPMVFAKSKAEREKRALELAIEEREGELMKKVGQLTVEVDFLKKKYRQIHGHEPRM